MSSDITLRLEKGTDLSFAEGDENFTHIRRLYRFTEDSVTSGGAGNAYSITSTNTPQTSFVANMVFGFIASFTNNAVSPTVTIDALDPKEIVRGDGTSVASGEIVSGNFYLIRYNNATDNFRLVESAALLSDIAAVEAVNTSQATELTNIRTTQGVASGATNLGTFPGSIISNNTTVKNALTQLESAVESNDTDISNVTNTANANANFIADFASVASSNPGSIIIPYSTTNAIVINWGSLFVPGGQTTLSDSFATTFTAAYQAFATIRDNAGGPNDPCTVPTLTTTGLSITNNDANGHTISWVAIGRKSI